MSCWQSDDDESIEENCVRPFSAFHKNYHQGDDFQALRTNGSYGSMIQNAPKLNVQDVQLWSQSFLTYAKGNNDLDDIVLGKEEYPNLADGETDRRLNERRSCFLRRKQAAHLMIKSAVERGTDTTTSRIFVSLVVDEKYRDRPASLWKALMTQLNVSASTDKTVAVVQWMESSNRDQKLSLDDYAVSHAAKFHRVNAAKATIEDINGILFLYGLDSSYTPVIERFMQRDKFTADEVFKQAKTHDAMQKAIKTSGFATETARSATETEEKVDDTALYSTSGKRTSSYSRRGKGGGGNYSKRGKGRGNGYDRQRGPSMRSFKGKYYGRNIQMVLPSGKEMLPANGVTSLDMLSERALRRRGTRNQRKHSRRIKIRIRIRKTVLILRRKLILQRNMNSTLRNGMRKMMITQMTISMIIVIVLFYHHLIH